TQSHELQPHGGKRETTEGGSGKAAGAGGGNRCRRGRSVWQRKPGRRSDRRDGAKRQPSEEDRGSQSRTGAGSAGACRGGKESRRGETGRSAEERAGARQEVRRASITDTGPGTGPAGANGATQLHRSGEPDHAGWRTQRKLYA